MPKRKPLSELTIMSDFIFYAVMDKEERIKPLLEEVLGLKISKIETILPQMTLKEAYEAKGVRLDVVCWDMEGNVYDIEVQTAEKNDEGKRSRFYSGSVDVKSSMSGMKYKDIKDSYVIFICNFDMFGRDWYVYPFQNYCDLDKEIQLNDGSHKIFVNTKGTVGNISPELKRILYYFNDGVVSDEYTEMLDEAVKHAKTKKEWIDLYAWILNHDDMVRDEGREENAKETARRMIARGKDTYEEIAEITGLSLKEVEVLAGVVMA